QAYIHNSSIDATGALTQTATATDSIDALVVAASVGIAGGASAGVGVSGAGGFTDNQIHSVVHSYIDGDSTRTPGDAAGGITVASADLKADDASSIRAIAGAASVAASYGAIGVAVSIGLSIAFNTVSNDVAAYVNDVHALKTTTGNLTIEATTE